MLIGESYLTISDFAIVILDFISTFFPHPALQSGNNSDLKMVLHSQWPTVINYCGFYSMR